MVLISRRENNYGMQQIMINFLLLFVDFEYVITNLTIDEILTVNAGDVHIYLVKSDFIKMFLQKKNTNKIIHNW